MPRAFLARLCVDAAWEAVCWYYRYTDTPLAPHSLVPDTVSLLAVYGQRFTPLVDSLLRAKVQELPCSV